MSQNEQDYIRFGFYTSASLQPLQPELNSRNTEVTGIIFTNNFTALWPFHWVFLLFTASAVWTAAIWPVTLLTLSWAGNALLFCVYIRLLSILVVMSAVLEHLLKKNTSDHEHHGQRNVIVKKVFPWHVSDIPLYWYVWESTWWESKNF